MRHVLITNVETDAAHVIKGLRTEKGLTLRQLAAISGVSKSGLSRWERGERVPTLDVFIRILRALDAEIAVLRTQTREG